MLIGIDWGGTKIEAIALDEDGTALARRRIATPQHDYDAGIRAAADLVRGIEAELGRDGTVGIGIPGAISPATGLVKNANSTWLNGRPLDKDIEQALGRSGPGRERRQLPRPLGSDGRRRRRMRRWSGP